VNKSENIGELAKALSKFQSEVGDVHKSRQGYGYKYADLCSVLDTVRPLCAKNGLSVSQLCVSPEDPERVGVETVLMHESGQWISSVFHMPVEEKKPLSSAQTAGVVITYARRYALAAVLGITQTDDDGVVKASPVAPKLASKEVLGKIDAMVDLLEVPEAEQKSWLTRAKAADARELTMDQGNKILEMLQKRMDK
jgi:hypothetical protein